LLNCYREVDVDENMRMDPSKLEQMILEDQARGQWVHKARGQ
jgi:hypothetical protein